MEIRQLEWFVTVADLGSFTKAAWLLQVPQPALSRQVRALEVELHAEAADLPLVLVVEDGLFRLVERTVVM